MLFEESAIIKEPVTETPEIVDPAIIDYRDQESIAPNRLSNRLRYQLPIILACSAICQMIGIIVILGDLVITSLASNSMLAAQAANLLSLLNYGRLRSFPGSRRLAFVLPAFVMPWLFTASFLLAMRPPYSVPLLVIGFASAAALAWVFMFLSRRAALEPMLLVPSPRVKNLLSELPGINHRLCRSPDEIIGRHTIVADLHEDLPADWEKAIAEAVLQRASVYHVKHVRESLSGRVKIDHMSENTFGTLGPNSLYFTLKAITERVIGLVGLILFLPIIAVACLAILIEDRGSPIFKQERIGYLGKPFTIIKLRTMRTAVPDKTREAAITKANDSRITKVGAFLRKTRIDELPQFWNMLRGELSLIGPRPEAAILSQWYSEALDFYAYRHVVKPGITGWAQVNQGHVADDASVARKLEYDFYYIKNFSFWLDIMILLRTIRVVLSGHGAR
ncbi:MAG: sugar transferase [Alteraurantiacibacter sp. bin_em_oilr2.035]|nr:sugar transferase [Alteraurantiacibacter sp. bin_em_oilr2.035]